MTPVVRMIVAAAALFSLTFPSHLHGSDCPPCPSGSVNSSPDYFRTVLPRKLRSSHGKGVLIGIVYAAVDWKQDDFWSKANKDCRIRLLVDQPGNGLWTDDQLKRLKAGKSGAVPPPDTTSSGTAVAILAAGDEGGVATDADIVVFIPGNEPKDLVTAAHYIFAQAGDGPAVVCIPRGTIEDPSSLEDLGLISSSPGKIVVAAAGNLAGRGVHAVTEVPANDASEFSLLIPPSHAGSWDGSVVVNLYYPPVDSMSVSVIDPDEAETTPIFPGSPPFDEGGIFIQNGTQTFSLDTKVSVAIKKRQGLEKAETWRIRFESRGMNSVVPVRGWIVKPRDRVSAGQWVSFTQDVSDSFLVEWPASLSGVLAVGGYDSRSRVVASFSSPGWVSGAAVKPDFVAPAVCIESPVSSQHTGHPNASTRINCGTSLAAPLVAGMVALILERSDHPLSLDEVRDQLKSIANTKDEADFRIGHGRLLR